MYAAANIDVTRDVKERSEANNSKTAEFTCTYFLGVVIDAGNRVVESAENNNVAFGEIPVK